MASPRSRGWQPSLGTCAIDCGHERPSASAPSDGSDSWPTRAATWPSSLDYETTLERVAWLAVPALADWCLVDVLDEDGEI